MIRAVGEENVCGECGSGSLVASGVFEHGTWIHRLTCWTCLDCRSVLAIPESEATVTIAPLARTDTASAQ